MTSERQGKPNPGDAIRELVAEKVAGKVAEKLSEKAVRQERIAERAARRAEKIVEHANRHERIAAKAAKKAETLDRISSGLGVLDLWTRTEPASRRPRFTRDEIAAAAMQIADTDGFGALSMRRLATDLDAGTMTLYHYVHTKDEVLTLVVDAVMGEVVLGPDEPMPTDWREALTMIAEKSRAALQNHPWILDIADDPPIGPNSVRHFDESLQAVASLSLSLADRFDIVSAVDEYVFGFCLFERNNREDHAKRAAADMTAYVNGLVESGDYPQLAALADEYGLEGAWDEIGKHMRDPDRFGRNLARLLDGIESDLVSRTTG